MVAVVREGDAGGGAKIVQCDASGGGNSASGGGNSVVRVVRKMVRMVVEIVRCGGVT